MDPIKEAFTRAKIDIAKLQKEIYSLSQQVEELRNIILYQMSPININTFPTQSNIQTHQIEKKADEPQIPTHSINQPTNQHIIPTHNLTELNKVFYKGLKTPYNNISIGNEGVTTNQPTNQPTNQHIGNEGVYTHKQQKTHKIDRLEHISKVLESLGTIKKDIRKQFKCLTAQEMNLFSEIYKLEEQGFIVDYAILSEKLSLSEISIRDYTRKLIKKGIPIQKHKENNKKILLSISPEFKQIASLETIYQLREL